MEDNLRRIARFSRAAGFDWEQGFESSEALFELLTDGLENDNPSEFGLSLQETGKDSGFWLVADPERFAAIEAKCRELDEPWDYLTGEEVADYIRTS